MPLRISLIEELKLQVKQHLMGAQDMEEKMKLILTLSL